MKKSIKTELEWQEKNVNESNLNKPYESLWQLYHWNTIFNKIISSYNFNNKKVFVGGCGTGLFEEWLLKKSKMKPQKIISMDLSPKQIKLSKIRCKGLKNLKFLCGNIERTKFKDKSFDVCLIIDALHHVPDASKVIKEMKRIATDLILFEPNKLNPIRRINELKYLNKGCKEISFYSWEIRRILKKNKYTKISITNQLFIPSFAPKFIIKNAKGIDLFFIQIPLLNKFSGALFILAKSN